MWQEYEKESTIDSFLENNGSSKSEISLTSQLSILQMDYRIDWIRKKVTSFLDLDDSCNLFNDLIHNNNNNYGKKLGKFLNADTYGETDLEKKQVFFYKTYRDEIVQEEVSVWEEGKCNFENDNSDKLFRLFYTIIKLEQGRKKVAAVGSFAVQVKPQRLVKSAPDDKRKSKGKSGKKAKKVDLIRGKKKLDRDDSMKTDEAIVSDNVEESPTALQSTSGGGDSEEADEFADDEDDEELGDQVFELETKEKSQPSLYSSVYEPASFVPPAGQEENYILTRKVVDRVMRIPILHCLFGEMDHSALSSYEDQRLVYFCRISDSAVPQLSTRTECWAEMPRHVLAGSLLYGKFLFAMDQILEQVFLPLVSNQFRGPEAAQDKALRSALTWMMETPGIERAAGTLCNLLKSQGTEFVPPSSMRRVSLLSEGRKSVAAHSLSAKSDGDANLEPSRKELLEYLSNLIEAVAWTCAHVEGEVLLYIPDAIVNSDVDATAAADDPQFIQQLEGVVMSWEKHIKKVLETHLSKVPEGKGPLAEHTYWHEREHGLSLLVEQLNSVAVARILNILNDSQSAVGAGFAYFARELIDCYAEARENNKFLSTVLRQFKTVTTSDSFKVISTIIPSIYEQLRMIWVLSKYYSTEERMVSLLERISWQLRQTVTKNLALRDITEKLIVKNDVQVVLQKTSSAHEMLKLWKGAYLSTRLSIELSGNGARWEFDQQRLFKETDYLASVSADLHHVAGVLRDFYNIFGEELKSIVDDPARIDSIVDRVGQLLGPIRNAEADAFNEYNRESWEATMSWFQAEVARLELEAEIFIDECFGSLINAEDALAMLIKFRSMQTRDAVHERLSRKFDLIMQQFSREIDEVEELFHKGRLEPPLLRDHLPIAGAIYWERNLFHRLASPVKRFQQVSELENSELGAFISEQYAAVAKQMQQFENALFASFIAKAQRTLQSTMKKNVLILQSRDAVQGDFGLSRRQFNSSSIQKSSYFDAKKSTSSSIRTDATQKTGATTQDNSYEKSDYTKITRSKTAFQGSTSTKRIDHQLLKSAEPTCDAIFFQGRSKLVVNFDDQVFNIIRESELLEHLGFALPPFVREIGIQKNRLCMDCRAVNKMIDQFNETIGNVDEATLTLLRQTLDSLQKHIQPGLTRLNWYSLGITDYADTCSKLLKNLTSIIRQVKQTRQDLDSQISQELELYNLFATERPSSHASLQSCKDFFDELENKRTRSVGRMLKCYQSINPMLMKLEGLVEGTASGKSLAMTLHYEHYEQRVFVALIACFLRNLQHFKDILFAKEPLFYVDAALFASQVVLKPSAGDVYTIILRDVKDLMERLKIFPRWMSRSCLECQSFKDDAGAADLTTFSFFEDVMGVQAINELIFALQDAAYKLSHDCWIYLYKWKQYSNLWSLDKTLVCDKFVAANPTLQQYDEKFAFYDSIINELDEIDDFYDVFSIRINLCQLIQDIKSHAKEWKQVLASFLLAQTTQAMNELKNNIERYKSNVELVINGLERFKLVMQCISQIKSSAIEVEVEYSKLQETFRILRFHKVAFPVEDERTAYQLQKDWESLYLSALYRLNSLESTKDQFCDMTRYEINDFGKDIANFIDKFALEGPGSCGDDLDSGMEKMEEYGQQISQLDRKLRDLTNAELLFDLAPADYSNFYAAKRDYEAMEELFKLYKAQKIARDTWAKTLWADLNPQQLIDGMDNYLKELRKMPKAVRNLNVGRALETSMKNFKNSVPLFVELKNEAMRERHWQELMDRTGKHFDMTPSRFADN